MKKIFLILLVAFISLNAQIEDRFVSTTVVNSTSYTYYITIPSNTEMRVDSIALQGIFTGEIDVDQLIVTKGVLKDIKGAVASMFIAVATPDTTTLTIDNAAATTTASVYTPTSTGLTNLPGSGYNAVRVVFVAGSAGNDATDPNRLQLVARKAITILK